MLVAAWRRMVCVWTGDRGGRTCKSCERGGVSKEMMQAGGMFGRQGFASIGVGIAGSFAEAWALSRRKQMAVQDESVTTTSSSQAVLRDIGASNAARAMPGRSTRMRTGPTKTTKPNSLHRCVTGSKSHST